MHNVCLEMWQFDMIIDSLMSLNKTMPSTQIIETIDSVKQQITPIRKEKSELVDPFSNISNDPINW